MYVIYGTIAKEVDEQNRGVDPAQKSEQATNVIHETPDREEARTIMEAGGFIKEGVWLAADHCVDTNKSGSDVPKRTLETDQTPGPLKKSEV